jgi:NTP pyrophosphatase (non-canonical NTP hydrolase)
VGDLAKLYLAKKGFAFSQKETDKKFAQELADCFWSVLVLAEELDIDLEAEFNKTLNKLEDKIQDRGVKRAAGKKLV